ncbi:hypothetical protein ERJ75_000247800 [Trypanosoma vivax]|uniref:Uncharacterized protein n=1 Tax=Trypanosoma vivax (strain Y486) TaxID=1055687 RepID=G0U1U4_TRYVY|nr:hypothetical protein ERJ75_000247800 [Trypanosoma vivax]CCC50243.1 conserved hypothetical protein [Trypanosoma vivax Y486]
MTAVPRHSAPENDAVVAALRRLEEAGVAVLGVCRQLRRTMTTLQHHIAAHTRCQGCLSQGANGQHVLVGPPASNDRQEVASGTMESLFMQDAAKRRAITATYRNTAILTQRKLQLARIWQQLVIDMWFKPCVLEAFCGRVSRMLYTLSTRLDRAAAALKPTRRLQGLPHCLTLLPFLSAPKSGSSTAARWRSLAEAIFLAVRIPQEFSAQITENNTEGSEACSHTKSDPCASTVGAGEVSMCPLSPISLSVDDISALLQCLIEVPVEENKKLRDSASKFLQLPGTLVSLHAPGAFHCLAGKMGLNLQQSQSPNGPLVDSQQDWTHQASTSSFKGSVAPHCVYSVQAQTFIKLIQEKSRSTSDAIVARRAQLERNEARWYTLHSDALSILRNQPETVSKIMCSSSSEGKEVAQFSGSGTAPRTCDGDYNVTLELVECILWLASQHMRRSTETP